MLGCVKNCKQYIIMQSVVNFSAILKLLGKSPERISASALTLIGGDVLRLQRYERTLIQIEFLMITQK